MSAHKMHHSPELLQAMKNHGLVIETPSQLSDCFRFGWTAATDLSQASVAAALEAAAGKCDAFAAFRQKQLDDDEAKHWQDQDAILKRAWKMSISGLEAAASEIRALIAPDQHDALAAHVAAEVAKARAEDAKAVAYTRSDPIQPASADMSGIDRAMLQSMAASFRGALEFSFNRHDMAELMDRCAARPASAGNPASTDMRVVAAALWREESINAGAPDSVATGRTLSSFADQSPELQARWCKFAACAIRAIIGDTE